MFLQMMLLRKYFNYTDKSRTAVRMPDIVLAMTRDVQDVVHNGYVTALTVVLSLCRLVMLLAFLFFITKEATPLLVATVLCLAILGIGKGRQDAQLARKRDEFESQNLVIDHVLDTIFNYQVIADYDRRTNELNKFEAKIDNYNKAASTNANFAVNSKYAVIWLVVVVVTSFILVGGSQVLSGDLELAVFLTILKIFLSIGLFAMCEDDVSRSD